MRYLKVAWDGGVLRCRHAVALAGAVGALAFGAGVMPALAQQTVTDPRALYDRLLRLERDVQALQGQLSQNTAPPSLLGATGAEDLNAAEAAGISLRLDQIEATVRTMTGQLERLQFDTRQALTKLDTFAADTDYRLRALEGTDAAAAPSAAAPPQLLAPPPAGQGLSPAQQATVGSLGSVSASGLAETSSRAVTLTPPPYPSNAPPPSAASPALPQGDADTAYKYAVSFLRQGDYAAAEAAFSQFLEAYGDTKLAGNAQYWLGETYYVRGQYQRAARAFLTGYQKYAASPKAPDSLLKLGITLVQLGQTEDACLTLSEVPRTFPSAPQSVKLRAEQERTRAGCV